MRLHRLELQGFGPFRDRQVVDFDAFAADGIFLITGRTGAGKSSILDGVCFALYGDVPRYSGSDKRLRSDHCAPDDPTEVQLEFSLGDRRLRVTRSPEYSRPKRRGEGLTPVKQQAQVDEWAGDGWVGRASGPRDAGLLLGEVLGLTREQFLQVILLAQGRFAQFLLAGNDERQAVLRTLFGTRRYEDYARVLVERRKQTREGVDDAQRSIEALLAHAEQVVADADVAGAAEDGGSDPAAAGPAAGEQPAMSGAGERVGSRGEGETIAVRIEALAVAGDRARHRVEVGEAAVHDAQKARTGAEHALAEGRRIAQGQAERTAERAALVELEADAPAIAACRVESAQASSAEALRATIEALARREAELVHARGVEQSARAALGTAGFVEPDAAEPRLQSAIDEWVAQLASWHEAVQLERQLPVRRALLESLTVQIGEARGEREQLDVALAAAPARAAELDRQIDEAAEAAGAGAGLAERIEVDGARLGAARELVGVEKRLVEAEAGYAAAAAAAEDAGRAVVQLLQRRLQNHAGELAADLVPGEPCVVCGATEHPQPAPPVSDVVTDRAIAAAERTRDTRREAENLAQTAAREVRRRRADLAEQCGGVTVAELEDRLTHLRAQADAAAAARTRRDALVAERARAAAEIATAGQRRDALAEQITGLSREYATAAESVRIADEQLAAARGPAASVSERIAMTTALRTATVAVVDAARVLRVAQSAADEARADLAGRVEASGFADADAATGALRDAAVRERLAERIASHEKSLAAHRARLFDLELQLFPEEPVDLAGLQEGHDQADEAYRVAVAAAARAATTATTLAGLHGTVQAEHQAFGPLAAAAERIAALADTISGRGANTRRMTLEAFVLAAELEEIVDHANVRLDEMSSGRYRLQHTDARAARGAASGLGIEVMDAYTGVARPATSLSGGETFLASLALALGLADVVTARTGGIRLDTLFVDEGFGSLDSDTLEIAMGTLETLRHGGRTVGVISHVDAMREQLPVQLRVVAGAHGPSRIDQQTFAGAGLEGAGVEPIVA